MRRVLIYSRRYPPDVRGGAETVIEALVGEVRRAGLDHRLVVGWQRSPVGLPPDAARIDLRCGGGLLGQIAQRARASAAVWTQIRSFRPDVVLSNSVEVPPSGRPTVVIAHDFAFGQAASDRRDPGVRARELGWWLASRHARLAVAVSEVTRDRLVDLGWPAARIRVVRGGVDLERFSVVALSPSPRLRLVMVSRFVREKGAAVAVEAVGRLVARGVDVELTLAGADEDPAWRRELARRAVGLPVRVLPDAPDVVALLQAADVVLFPTLVREGLGLAAVEAMACGRPVVHSDDPAVIEACAGVGVAFARGDADALAARIEALAGDPSRREDLGKRGRALCEQRYGWPSVFAAYRAVLDEAAEAGP